MDRSILLSIFVLLLFSVGCEQEWVEPYQTYTIKKGEHWSTYKQSSLLSDQLNFTVVFDESAMYKCEVAENQYDINKLLGFSDCNSMHHENSARFGWCWTNDQLEIHAYCYVDGERKTELIGAVRLNEPSNYSLEVTESQYIFKLDQYPSVSIDRGRVCNVGVYYMLYPYFGGNEKAPQDISIQLRIDY
ncbi:hypothetical protein BFP72_04610 [Reichenbachiella sp. 5M10]|uniref:hypothetical protein n=1 Tax=Reichenbachiella sp. 5M10 TaxID=1889772 RepID=UPI000C155A01|nr:hypothetical protein [Reichenbachiella sp. 5M10]PIB34738.1 hypothetical protein BFP72_04610 [Reichenbachiella sp. 5M10]